MAAKSEKRSEEEMQQLAIEKGVGEGYEFHLHATDNIDALIGLLSASQSKPAK